MVPKTNPQKLTKPPMHSGLQTEHVVDPVTLAYDSPSAHLAHSVLPVAEIAVPTGHGAHRPAPASEAAVPAAHGKHCVMPSLLAKVPGAHRLQVEKDAEAVMLEAEPMLHNVQDDMPEKAANDPAGHAGHCATDDPEMLDAVPALHPVHDELPHEGCVLPGGHSVQFEVMPLLF